MLEKIKENQEKIFLVLDCLPLTIILIISIYDLFSGAWDISYYKFFGKYTNNFSAFCYSLARIIEEYFPFYFIGIFTLFKSISSKLKHKYKTLFLFCCIPFAIMLFIGIHSYFFGTTGFKGNLIYGFSAFQFSIENFFSRYMLYYFIDALVIFKSLRPKTKTRTLVLIAIIIPLILFAIFIANFLYYYIQDAY